jgi:hypothetical protein
VQFIAVAEDDPLSMHMRNNKKTHPAQAHSLLVGCSRHLQCAALGRPQKERKQHQTEVLRTIRSRSKDKQSAGASKATKDK